MFGKKIIKAVVVFAFALSSFSLVFAQKLDKPQFLGIWTYGEDPSEFLLHLVMEASQSYLKDNPDGKLIVRMCSSEDFYTAFVKTSQSPFAASNYNRFYIIVPYEKIFVAKSSICREKYQFVHNEYWFVPADNMLEYEEIFPVNKISYENFSIGKIYDFKNDRYEKKSLKTKEKEFAENITKFINELKSNPKTIGLIVHNSKGKKLKRNIEKVKTILEKENINSGRIKTVKDSKLEENKKGKLVLVKDDGDSFPSLITIAVEK